MRSIADIRRGLDDGIYDAKLARLYCRPVSEAAAYRERVLRLINNYCGIFKKDEGSQAAVFSAPGRTELGGNHTDHQGGKVLAGAVDLDALACAAPNGTDEIRVFSEDYGMSSVTASDLSPKKDEEGTARALIRGVAAGIAGLGYRVGGFDAFVNSNVPGGSGLSSSACFEVLMGTVANSFFCGGSLTPVEIAKVGQLAENRFFGKPSGLLDQMGCAIGGVIAVDFGTGAGLRSSGQEGTEDDRQKRSLGDDEIGGSDSAKDSRGEENAGSGEPYYRRVKADFDSAGYALCIVDTGADHKNLTADYAAIPAEMKSVAAYFGKNVLSEVDESEFFARIPELFGSNTRGTGGGTEPCGPASAPQPCDPDIVRGGREVPGDRAIMRAMHYFAECRRVEEQAEALDAGDNDRFLRLTAESGRSSFMYLQNVSTYREPASQPVAVALAAAEHLLRGRGACRVHGGGFAGTIQAFVPKSMLEEFTAGMDSLLGAGACRVTNIRPVGCCELFL